MNVLVFRVGQLGDTVSALPAFWAVREHFKNDRLSLLSVVHHGKKYVLAKDLLEGSGLFDEFVSYVYHPSRVMGAYFYLRLLMQLRARRFDTLIYLYPPGRSAAMTAKDRRFFTLAGITKFFGMEASFSLPPREKNGVLPVLTNEADLTLARLAASGIPLPARGEGRMDLGLGVKEERAVEAWLTRSGSDGGRPWLGIGPGSKMPAKIWPEERFRETVAKLIERYDFQPVIFGGPEDAPLAARLIAAWRRGFNAAGELSLRESAAALKRCRLYLGNDTGTMHLAAAGKVPCVAIFSARDYPGRWEPYGVPKRILRTNIDCEGCMLEVCTERRMECVLSIGVDRVVEACVELLSAPR